MNNTYHGGTETRRKAKIFAADLRGSTQIGTQGLVCGSEVFPFDMRSSAQVRSSLVFLVPPCLSGGFKN